MKRNTLIVICALALLALPLAAQETPKSIVTAYDALADTILSVRAAERTFVAAMLDGHMHASEVLMKKGDWLGASAQMALFANEGDNQIGGVRKKLLEGGHHFNAAGEEQGIYEPGYVIVTREAKQSILEISKELRTAETDEARAGAWGKFAEVVDSLMKPKAKEPMAEKAMAKEPMAEKAMAEKAMAEKAMAEKAMAEKAMAEKAMAEKAMAEKAMAEEPMPKKPEGG